MKEHISGGRHAQQQRRIILSESQAIEIYQLKPAAKNSTMHRHERCQSQSRIVAENYGVSPKTVRDIWNRKTWVFATMNLILSDGSQENTRMPACLESTELSIVAYFNPG